MVATYVLRGLTYISKSLIYKQASHIVVSFSYYTSLAIYIIAKYKKGRS